MTDGPTDPAAMDEAMVEVVARAMEDYFNASDRHKGEHFRAAQTALTALNIPAMMAWKQALLDELMITHLYTEDLAANPKAAINAIMAWHQAVALDPAVSADARTMMDKVRREERERCAKVAEDRQRKSANLVSAHTAILIAQAIRAGEEK